MNRRTLILFVAITFLLALAVFTACQMPTRPVRPSPPVFLSSKLAEMDTVIVQAVQSNRMPGAVLWLERNRASHVRAHGSRALIPAEASMTSDTVFDMASLTKVVATAPAIVLLMQRGQLDLDAPVQKYIPAFQGHGKERITVRQLLTHTSGLRPGLSSTPSWSGYEKAIQLACEEKPAAEPDAVFRYSDINFIVLGEIVRRVSGQRLDQFVRREVFQRLKMLDTEFLPPPHKLQRIAPTEVLTNGVLHGIVHDPTARRMGGVAGHAGLFSTAADLARFARMLLNGGEVEGVRIFAPETVRVMTSVQSPAGVPARRGLGWDIDSPYSRPRGQLFPIGSYGHTGWTGTSIWIDPFSRTFVILLSNRNHPTEAGSVLALREQIGTLAAEAVLGFDFQSVPGALPRRSETAPASALVPEIESLESAFAGQSAGADMVDRPARSAIRQPRSAPVLNGIDVLVRQEFAPLKGLRVGLITNQTGTDRARNSTIDLLSKAPGVSLKALFSPEHGIRGEFDEKVSDSVDAKTGLPIYSLYGESRSPRKSQLQGLDALVFDIQDIGCRFYTYISTMGLCLEAASRAGLKFFVLDRVNPINGANIDGPVLRGATSFTGFHEIPVRHGMTVGELARLFNRERGWKADLTVIPLQGWKRSQWHDETGLPWTNPSPNMRSLTAATLYPGVGLLETTRLSVGRGTGTPFEVVGAPYIDDVAFAAALNDAGVPGVRFVPIRFTPTASVFKGERCAGVNIVLLDREQCPVIDLGILMASTLHRLYPGDFDLEKFNRLLVHSGTVQAIRAGENRAAIRQSWEKDLAEFRRRRGEVLLYD